MKDKITNHCGAMGVYATLNPWLRRTAKLLSTGVIFRGEMYAELPPIQFTLTFPRTPVRFVSLGRWRVDAGRAEGVLGDGRSIFVDFEPEGVHRASAEECRKYGGQNLMIAEEFGGIVSIGGLDDDNVVGRITYPEVAADPGMLFGLFSYTVREFGAGLNANGDAVGELDL